MEHKMEPKMECSEAVSLYINYGMDDTGVQYLWDLYFEHIEHVEYINTLHGIKSEERTIAIHGNYMSESESRKIRLGSKLPPNYQGNFSERNAITHVMSDMFKYLYKQTKEQAKTIQLLSELMTKQEELLHEQSLKLEQYINGEEVIVLKQGVFKPK
jgi:hypothetical protein